jgi:hypothetical protein
LCNEYVAASSGTLDLEADLSAAAPDSVVCNHHPHVITRVLDEVDALSLCHLVAGVGRVCLGVVVRIEQTASVHIALSIARPEVSVAVRREAAGGGRAVLGLFVTTLRPPAISAIRRAFGDGITRIGTATDVVFHLRVLGWEHIDRLDQLPEFVR